MDSPNPKPRRPLTPEAFKRQREGQYKGLLRAAQKRKADNSANYANNFKHGQMAFDFERSAAAAGESREELRAHLSLFDRTLLTLCGFFPRISEALSGEGAAKRPAGQAPRLPLHTDAASPRAPKLVRALGLLLWRPLRLYRNQENWERLAITYRLEEMKRWRQQNGDLTAERSDEFHWDLDATLENYHSYTRERLKRIERRFWKVWRVYRGMVGVVGLVFGTRDAQLPIADCRLPIQERRPFTEPASEGRHSSQPSEPVSEPASSQPSELPIAAGRLPIEEPTLPVGKEESTTGACPALATDAPGSNRQSAIENQQSLANRQSTIDNRQFGPSKIGKSLIQVRGTPHYEQFHPNWLARLDDLSPQAIGDPFQSPSHAMKAQQKRAESATVKDPEQWQERPPKPRPPEMDFSHRPASEFVRTPSERELRRMVRAGELTVPGSFEDFLTLVEEALGPELPTADCRLPIEQGLGFNRQSTIENRQSLSSRAGGGQDSGKARDVNRQSTIDNRQSLHALAESLWNRMHVFSDRVAELRDLLEATLEWQPSRFLRLWVKLLPLEYAYANVDFFRSTHGPACEDIAWGDDETTPPWRDGKQRPAEVPRSEGEERKKHSGELQHALRIGFVALRNALLPVMRSTHKVKVALYEWAVSRFGIREEFLVWRPNLSSVQRDTREGRPEWAVRVVTTTGKTLVKLSDGRILEPGTS